MNELDRVKADAMQDIDFFTSLVGVKKSTQSLKDFLVPKGYSLDEKELATLYLLINFGTVTVTAEEYLKMIPTKQDTGGKGVWA